MNYVGCKVLSCLYNTASPRMFYMNYVGCKVMNKN